MSESKQPTQTWVCDAIQISHTNVSENGVVYTIVFKDFLGIAKEIEVNRDDCFWDFPSVLKTLVQKGFRFNTLLPNVIAILQYQLTSYRPSPEQVAEAIKLHKAIHGKDGKGATPTETLNAITEAQAEDQDGTPETEKQVG